MSLVESRPGGTALARASGGRPEPAVPLPAHVSLHIAGEHGLLFDAERQLLFSASPGAAFIWCCFAEGLGIPATAMMLQRRGGLTSREAMRHIGDAIRNWRAAGLLRHPGDGDASAEAEPAPGEGSHVEVLRLLDTGFLVEFAGAALPAAVEPLLAPLRAGSIADDFLHVAVHGPAPGYVVSVSDGRRAGCSRAEEVAALLLEVLRDAALERATGLGALRAGAVGVDGGCILLAGGPGTGTSTLVAGLAAAGHPALGDETMFLSGDPPLARPAEPAIGVGQGAWKILAKAYPELRQGAPLRRPDGRAVRFLPLMRSQPGQGHPVRGLLFPRHTRTPGSALVELAPADALVRLMRNADLRGRRLDAQSVELLLRWTEDLPCHEMRYGALPDAVRLFRRTLR